MTTRAAAAWLRGVLAEAAASQDDPVRDAAFRAWKDEHEARRKKKKPDRHGISVFDATAGRTRTKKKEI